MKKSSTYLYFVEYGSKHFRWDGISTLFLGFPIQWSLDVKVDQVYCRNLLFKENQKFQAPLESFDNKGFLQFEINQDGRSASIKMKRVKHIQAAAATHANPKEVPQLSKLSAFPTSDALLFRRSLKEASASTAALILVFCVWTSLTAPKRDELIPPQFAKMILKKASKSPSHSQSSAPSSGGAVHKAKDSAVAQAFRSQSVQKSVQSLLRGGLTKFNTAFAVPSSKALGALADATKNSHDKSGALRGLASQVLGSGTGVSVASIGSGGGSEVGYGTGAGSGAAVAGQGKGFVSLDTQEASVDEGLTKEEVARVIHAHMNEIRYCYESAILKNSNLEGKLLVDFQIEAAGSVKKAGKKESSVSESGVSDCVIRRLVTWQFPKPRGGVTVAISYPFLFKTVKR